MGEILLLFGALFFILLTAFFTAAETALISSDRMLLQKSKKKGSRSAAVALKMLEDLDSLLTTTQFGSNLCIATATTLATLFVSRVLENNDVVLLLAFGPFVLIFSDSLPKVLGRHYSFTIALAAALPILLFSQISFPVVKLLSFYTQKLSQIFHLGKQDALSRRKKTREELHAMLHDSDSQSDIRLGHKRIIRKILEFSHQSVRKVMLPLVRVDAVEKNISLQEAIEIFETLRHSRLPVFEERIDNIVGILHFQDVFACKDPSSETVSAYMRKPLFVPEVQLLQNLTEEMREQEAEIAIVVDEYGGAVGIVTKEDVVEEIVGDISDEWDDHSLTLREINANTWLVHVGMPIHELNERLNMRIPKGEYETLSGFLLQQFNRIPEQGAELFYGNLRIRVHRANPRAVETVIIELPASNEEEQDA